MMVVAALQRVGQGGIDLNTGIFLALYSAIPAMVGIRSSRRGGFLCGFFGMFGALSVLYPAPVPNLAAIGVAASGPVWLSAALVAGAVGGLAGSGGLAAAAACLLWLLVPVVADSSVAWTAGYFSAVFLAASASALACLGGAGEERSEAVSGEAAERTGDALSEA
jgi:hypothetical protein